MSRLDSVIRRLTAQRATLDWASASVANRPGLVLELGLGNGRTYDHLRARLPGRRILAFDRHLAAHPSCHPGDADLVLGELTQTLPRLWDEHGPGCAVLIHADLGNGVAAESQPNFEALCPLLCDLLMLSGLFVSDAPPPAGLPLERVEVGPRPTERYFVHRRLAQEPRILAPERSEPVSR